MKSILILILIIIIAIIIFFFLNYILKKKIETYGIYCGMYNTTASPKISCNNDTECTWNTNLAYCTNKPLTYVEQPSAFALLQADLLSVDKILQEGPMGIDNALVNLGNKIQGDVINDTKIISSNVTSAVNNVESKVKKFDSTIFSKGSPIDTEEESK
jgi:hypothetical protein